jgi:hypothetical protein
VIQSTEFNIKDTEETTGYMYILRNLIRRNDNNVNEEIKFLLDIPSIRALAHKSINPDTPNELIRVAIAVGNEAAASILLTIDKVKEHAQDNNFYPSDRNKKLNLSELIEKSKESSLTVVNENKDENKDENNYSATFFKNPMEKNKSDNAPTQRMRVELIKELDLYIAGREKGRQYNYDFLALVGLIYGLVDFLFQTDYRNAKSKDAKINAANDLKDCLESGDTSKIKVKDINSLKDGSLSKIADQCISIKKGEDAEMIIEMKI